MKGSIYKSKSKTGRTTWRYEFVVGRDEQGNRIRESESGFKLEREARDAMEKKMREYAHGPVNTSSTFAGYMEQWLPHHAKAKPLAPKTAERYRSLAAHATRALGDVPLKDLSAFQFDNLYVKLTETLSAKTVREVHSVVHVALKRAVKNKLIPFNPADGCDLPRVDQKEAIALSPAQLEAFEQAAAGKGVDLLIRLAGAIGARRGELLACRWSDLDWNTSKLRIERSLYETIDTIGLKPTKTRQARTVVVPQSLIEYLKLHREQQEQNRTMFGPDYRVDLDLIFANPSGNFLSPDNIGKVVSRLAKKAGLYGVGLHALRHTHASALIAAGVPITNVSKRLGHRDAYTTAKVYAHALPDSDTDVAATWDRLRSEGAAKPAEEKPVPQIATNAAPKKAVTN